MLKKSLKLFTILMIVGLLFTGAAVAEDTGDPAEVAALAAVNAYFTSENYKYAEAPAALEPNLTILGLEIGDGSDYAKLETTEHNRKTAVFSDLNDNKPAEGYDLATLTTYFNAMVGTRLKTQESMDQVNNANSVEELGGISWVTLLNDHFASATYATHSGTPIADKKDTLQGLVDRYTDLPEANKEAALTQVFEGIPYARSQATLDALAAALKVQEDLIAAEQAITDAIANVGNVELDFGTEDFGTEVNGANIVEKLPAVDGIEYTAVIKGGSTWTVTVKDTAGKGTPQTKEIEVTVAADPNAHIANVGTLEDFKAALEDDTKTIINLTADFDTTEKILVSRAVTINGGNKTITFTGDEEGWQGNFVLHVYDTEDVVIKDISLTGGDAGLLVNGSEVTLEGAIDVSGNEFGGIEVSKGTAQGLEDSKLTVNATLTNGSEAYGQPTVWIDKEGGTVEGGEFTQSTTVKEDQVQFYLVAENIKATVTYDLNGGTGADAPKAAEYEIFTNIIVKPLPEGITNGEAVFVGWEDIKSTKLYLPGDVYRIGRTDAVTLKAVWSGETAPVDPVDPETPVQFVVSYVSGDNVMRFTVEEGAELEFPEEIFYKQGYKFTGWEIDGVAAEEGMIVESDLTLEAAYTELPILVEGNEKASIVDVIVLLQYTAKTGTVADMTETEMVEAGFDFNGDGAIDLIDVMMFLRSI